MTNQGKLFIFLHTLDYNVFRAYLGCQIETFFLQIVKNRNIFYRNI
jgi:hypothetical protein